MAEIQLTELTESTVLGNGVFDKLMVAMSAHLDREFDKNRIRGPEYSTVYLGGLNQVMSTALGFVMQKRMVGLQADLLAQQIILAGIEVTKANIALEILALDKIKAASEIELINAQVCKLKAEYDLTVNQNTLTTGQIALTAQKTATEKAQTQNVGVDADSVIGKQKALYQAQTDGFARDAEQKAAKLLVDTWSTRRMSDDGTVADATNMLNDSTIGRAVNKVLAGVNA